MPPNDTFDEQGIMEPSIDTDALIDELARHVNNEEAQGATTKVLERKRRGATFQTGEQMHVAHVAVKKERSRAIHEAVMESLQVRLAGRTIDGERANSQEDIQRISNMQKLLVRDPSDLIGEVERFPAAYKSTKGGTPEERYRKLDPDRFPFLLNGGHLSITPLENIVVMREKLGYAFLCELLLAHGKTLPVGYIYGLEQIPTSDDRFPTLCLEGLQPDSYTRQNIIEPNIQRIIYNNRTGVMDVLDQETIHVLNNEVDLADLPEALQNESLRREGIGSIVKYVVAQFAKARGKIRILLNIARLQAEEFWLPNGASEGNNALFLNDCGMRKENQYIRGKSPLTNEERIIAVQLKVWGNTLDEMIARLEEGILTKRGVDTHLYCIQAQEFAEWIASERPKGAGNGKRTS